MGRHHAFSIDCFSRLLITSEQTCGESSPNHRTHTRSIQRGKISGHRFTKLVSFRASETHASSKFPSESKYTHTRMLVVCFGNLLRKPNVVFGDLCFLPFDSS